jgi:hypothetical protein
LQDVSVCGRCGALSLTAPQWQDVSIMRTSL